MKAPHLPRRSALKTAAFSATAATFSIPSKTAAPMNSVMNNRIRQSVVPWCFKPMPPEELVEHSHQLGLPSVELIDAKH